MQRDSGQIAVGQLADMLSLDSQHSNMIAVTDDGWLDAWIFSGDDSLVTDVWTAGKQMVKEGRHVKREEIQARYDKTMRAVTAVL